MKARNSSPVIAIERGRKPTNLSASVIGRRRGFLQGIDGQAAKQLGVEVG